MLIMMKYLIVVFYIGCLSNLLVYSNNTSNNIFSSRHTASLIYNLSVRLLTSCDLNLKNIIIYDNITGQNTFSSIGEIQPQTTVTYLSDTSLWKQVIQYRVDHIEVDAVIIVINLKTPWLLMKNLFSQWPFNRDCLVYMVPVPVNDCHQHTKKLNLIMRFYFSAAYYVCLFDDQFIRVYTHDPYGDTKPLHWNRDLQTMNWGKNWTIYHRSYKYDMKESCVGFYFKRTDPVGKISPILGVGYHYIIPAGVHPDFTRDFKTKEMLIDNEEIEKYLDPDISQRVYLLKRLLKLRFYYFVVTRSNDFDMMKYAYHTTSVDAFIYPQISVSNDSLWNYFYSEHIDPYAIFSHNRGRMEPVEKIVKFYGKWTLVSLSVLLSITFSVIWFKTKKVYFAAFDIIKLLINADVVVPLDTLALKIFFTVIFLYFLVIHATFSGHLSEFLTSIKYRQNIETFNDLKNSRIKKLYVFGYEFDENEEFDDLRMKLQYDSNPDVCIEIMNEPDSACISRLSNILVDQVYLHDYNNSYYISKNTFDVSMLCSIYRPGFPLQEKFNWAIMYLFDTGILNNIWKEIKQEAFWKTEARIAGIYVQYRNIKSKDLYFAFLLLIIGNLVGIICFLLEIISKVIRNKLTRFPVL